MWRTEMFKFGRLLDDLNNPDLAEELADVPPHLLNKRYGS